MATHIHHSGPPLPEEHAVAASPVSKRGRWPRGLVALGILFVFPAIVWKLWPSTPVAKSPAASMPAKAYRQELTEPLMVAIRDGHVARVQSLLTDGADPNARDDYGDTALARAALYADVPIMRLLLDLGADANGRGSDGLTTLVRAVHDAEKARLLLEHGAMPDSEAMIVAARATGARARLEMLLAYGGMGQAEVNGYTALMAAAFNGDLEATRCLLQHGAYADARTPNGYTALYAAADAGNPDVISLLLNRGVDPNVVYRLLGHDGDLLTPALLAASLGHTECLRRLIAAGANVNLQGGPFERTALICAATTGRKDVIRLLLASGADPSATDWENDSAADWAARRGDADIVQLLRKAGAPLNRPSSSELRASNFELRPEGRRSKIEDRRSARQAIRASLPLLQRSERQITQKTGCVTCHQHTLLAMTIGLARQHGFAVDETIAAQERAHVLDHVRQSLKLILLGIGIEGTLASYILPGLAAENVPADRQTDALVHFLVLHQKEDGRWPASEYRPPEDYSDFFNTAMAVRGLVHYGSKGRRAEITARIARARQWLEGAKPVDTVEQAFRLLGLGWSGAGRDAINKAADSLLREQRQDGGWAQLPTLSSDAYATGLALFALHEAAHLSTDEAACRRGIEFLLKTQLADGSWSVASRCFPLLGYTSSGFPHGRSQFISAAATCWATMALVSTTPALAPAARLSRAAIGRRESLELGAWSLDSCHRFDSKF